MRATDRHPRPRSSALLAAALGLSAAACTLTLDLEQGRSCMVDTECTFVEGTGRCVDGRCQPPEGDGGTAATSIDAESGSGSETCASASCGTTDPGSSTDLADGSTSTDSSPPPGTGSEDSTGGGPFNPSCPPPYPIATSTALFDDLEAESRKVAPDNDIPQTEGRRGSWYLYNDGTGTQDPPAPDGLVPYAGGAEASEYGARTLINGFTDWGAGYGFPLNTVASVNCPYDLSGFDGIRFWAKGNGIWRLEVAHPTTTEAEGGGICVGACNDHFGIDLALASEWTLHEIAWESLEQVGWGEAGTFDPSEVIYLQWGRDGAAEMVDFEITLDDIGPWTTP